MNEFPWPWNVNFKKRTITTKVKKHRSQSYTEWWKNKLSKSSLNHENQLIPNFNLISEMPFYDNQVYHIFRQSFETLQLFTTTILSPARSKSGSSAAKLVFTNKNVYKFQMQFFCQNQKIMWKKCSPTYFNKLFRTTPCKIYIIWTGNIGNRYGKKNRNSHPAVSARFSEKNWRCIFAKELYVRLNLKSLSIFFLWYLLYLVVVGESMRVRLNPPLIGELSGGPPPGIF